NLKLSIRKATQSAKQRHAVSGEAPQVDIVAPAGARYNEAEISDLGLKLKRPMPDSQHLEPPVDVPSAIAPRRLMKASCGKVNLPSGLMEFFGNLRTGCAATYHQHCSGRRLAGIAIASRVNLK